MTDNPGPACAGSPVQLRSFLEAKRGIKTPLQFTREEREAICLAGKKAWRKASHRARYVNFTWGGFRFRATGGSFGIKIHDANWRKVSAMVW